MITRSSFFTRWRPFTNAGKRHRFFEIIGDQVDAVWNGFSRPIVYADISGAFSVAGVVDTNSARPRIAVTVLSYDEDNRVNDNIPVISQYMIRPGTSVGLGYIPIYRGERLGPVAKLVIWSAPPDFGTNSFTKFRFKVKTFGQENPYTATAFLQEPYPYNITLETDIYTEDYPVDSDPIINANQFPIS